MYSLLENPLGNGHWSTHERRGVRKSPWKWSLVNT